MEDKDKIAELFKDQLGSFEGNVRPELWSVVSAQAGVSASSAGSLSLLAKTLIGISVAAGVGGIGYFFYRNSNDNTTIQNKQTTIVSKSELKMKDRKSADVTIDQNVSSPVVTSADKHQLILQKDRINELPFIHQDPHDSVRVLENTTSGLLSTSKSQNKSENDQLDDHVIPVFQPNKSENTGIQQVDKLAETLGDASNDSTYIDTEQQPVTEFVQLFSKLPNAFTPNGDGANDYLFLTLNEPVTEFSIVILDRHNNVVFKSNNPDFHWDGTDMRGFPVEFGTYLYYVTGKDASGHMQSGKTILQITGN